MKPLLLLLTFTLALAAGCGARSSLHEPDGNQASSGADASADSGGERSCLPNCTVGHECCLGSCDGPAVQMPSDCCSCLAGEVSSFDCGLPCEGSP